MIWLALATLVMTSSGAVGANVGDEAQPEQPRRLLFREMYERIQPVQVYGKVLDQQGQPIAAADVMLRWETASFLVGAPDYTPKTAWLKSDDQGLWTFKIDKPHRVFVATVKKSGYEIVALHNFGSTGGDLVAHETTRDSPVITVLRKKGEPTFLLSARTLNLQILESQTVGSAGYDFIQQKLLQKHADFIPDDPAVVCDFQVRATLDTNTMTWMVVLSAGDTNGGLIVSDQLLYEAPETGYQPEYAFTPREGTPVKERYVYIKSREPAIYTRLEIEYINANEEFFRLSGKAVTNPYGERNLEAATDLSYEVWKQLTEEARAAFRENRRPPKPDLSKLMEKAVNEGEQRATSFQP